MFKPDPPRRRFRFGTGMLLPGRRATYADELQGHRLSFTAFKQAPWYMASKFPWNNRRLIRTPYFDNDLVALVTKRRQPIAQRPSAATYC